MATLKDYANLIVVEYIPVGITGFLAGITNFNFKIEYLTGILTVFFIISAYNTYNSIIDKQVDKINKPFRPLPKKTIKESDAFRLSIFFYILAITISYFINQTAVLICLAMVIATILYSDPLAHLKTRFLLGNMLAVFLYTVMIPAFGWALNPTNNVPLETIIFIFFVGLPSGILKDFSDISGDGFGRIKSLPVVIGYKQSKILSIIVYLFALLILSAFIYTGKFNILYTVLILPISILICNVSNLENTFSVDGHKENNIFQKSLNILLTIEIYLFLVNNFAINLYLF